MIESELFSKCVSQSEKDTALFFDRIGLKCIDLCFKITAEDGTDVTDIDGIFLDEENKCIIIYDDSKLADGHNPKILSFISKCQEDIYEQQIYDNHPDLPFYPIYILYIDKSRNSDANTSSIKHIFNETSKIIFLDDFEYFDGLTHKIGKWAKNDLYNYVEIFPPNKKVELDAIKIYIGNTPAYLFADKPNNILKYSYVSRRRGKDDGYQRMVDFSRIKSISDSIKDNSIKGFPNSILLNSTIPLSDDTNVSKSHCPKAVKLILPDHYSSCRIVDGQHRLISFSQLTENEQSRYNLSVVLLNNLPLEEEKKMFLDVNNNAKSVDPNLEYEIMSELDCWEDGSKEYLIKLSVKIISELEKSNPIKDKIFRGNIGDEKVNMITLKSFVDSIIRHKLIDKNIGIFQLKKTVDDTENPISILKKILIGCNINIADKDYLVSNRGIDVICSFWSNVFDKNNDKKFEQVYDEFILPFSKAINENIEELRKKYGFQGYKESIDIINDFIELHKKEIITNCKKDHKKTDEIVKKLSIDQSYPGRHRCASCAYEKGIEDAQNKIPKQTIEELSQKLSYSQAGKRRHRSVEEAYNLGYETGLLI